MDVSTVVFLALKLHEIDRDFSRKYSSVLGTVMGLDCERAAFLYLSPVVPPHFLREVGVDVVHAHGEQFFARIAQGPARGLVYINEPRVGPHPKRCVGAAIDGKLRETQCFLCPFPLFDFSSQLLIGIGQVLGPLCDGILKIVHIFL